MIKDCKRCNLSATRRHLVWGAGPVNAPLIFIGEGPGEGEDRIGKPFVPNMPAGRELNQLCKMVHINRDVCYVTNIVKCRPPNNRDPLPEEIAACCGWLEDELAEVPARVIVPLGRFATQFFLGDVDMEMVHGIPYASPRFPGRVIVPAYHPAAALHQPTLFLQTQDDFRVVGQVLRGERGPGHIVDEWEGKETYDRVQDSRAIYPNLPLAIDTESTQSKPFWGLSYSQSPGKAYVVDSADTWHLEEMARAVRYPATLVYLHNSLHDLPILESVGIVPARFADTMVMAYLVQNQPQGLKPLAYRLAGMTMKSYSDTVGPYTLAKALAYLSEAVKLSVPNPEPVIVWDKGVPKTKQPQNIVRKAAGILRDVAKGADPWERWHNIEIDEGRGQIEAILGPMPEGDVADLPEADAIYYSARDADATIRIAPVLWAMVEERGMADTFWRDMEAIRMVVDMMEAGIAVDLGFFGELSTYLESQRDALYWQIEALAGHPVNPGSPLQVKKLLFEELGLGKGEKKEVRRWGKKRGV